MLTFSQVLSHVFDKNQLSFHPQSKRDGIAENICLGDFRRQKHRDTQTLHLIDENPITLTDTCPSRDIIRQGFRLHLKNALSCLSTPRRLVFVLYYHHELPIKAIATRLNRSEGEPDQDASAKRTPPAPRTLDPLPPFVLTAGAGAFFPL